MTVNTVHVVDMGKDFSRYPAGRTDKDGRFNGTAFRNMHLIPFIGAGKKVIVLLDTGFSYGSSFLEEAFGGLIRAGVDKAVFASLVDLDTKDTALLEEIRRYVNAAQSSTCV